MKRIPGFAYLIAEIVVIFSFLTGSIMLSTCEFADAQVEPVEISDIEPVVATIQLAKIESEIEQFCLYDIPLSDELQEFTFDRCNEVGLEYELVLAVMFYESLYRSNVVSQTNDYGLMQISQINHEWLSKELGITDFLDPEQNIIAGTYILAGYAEKYDDQHKMLMAYNCGEYGASKLWSQGVFDTAYSRKIMAYIDELTPQEKGE